MKSFNIILLSFLLAFIAFLVHSDHVALGQTGNDTNSAEDLSVEINPGLLELFEQPVGKINKPAQVLVVVRNVSNFEIRDIKLSYFTNTPVGITIENSSIDTISPLGQKSWTLSVKPTGAWPISGTVFIQVEYLRPASGTASEISRLVIAPLEVKSHTLPQASQVAELQVKTTTDSLSQGEKTKVYLTLTNKSDFSIKLDSIEWNGEPFLETGNIPIDNNNNVIPAQTNQVFVGDVTAKDRVRPGKQSLVFEVSLSWENGGIPATGSYTATQEFNLEVTGLSDILQVLAFPSLLLLPGFLFLITFAISWDLWPFPQPKPSFIFNPPGPKFWALAIFISGIAMFLIPPVAGFFGYTINYLVSYSLNDLVIIYFFSVFTGVLIFFLFVYSRKLYSQKLTSRFFTGDSPATVLRKLNRRHFSHCRDVVMYTNSDKNQIRVLLLEPEDYEKDSFWIAPHIQIEFTEAANSDKNYKKELENAIKTKDENNKDAFFAGKLARLIRKGKGFWVGLSGIKKLTVKWEGPGNQGNWPRRVKKDKLELVGSNESIVEIIQ